jgi:asparagine synthetase B (glutamine-hydrolysing)
LLSRYISVKVRSPLGIFVTTLLQLRKNYIKVLSNMLKIIGYPREGDSSLPYLILAQFLREKEFALSIAGDDADSIYGGYDYYKFFAIQLLLEKRIPELLELMRILIKYNYSHKKKHSIMLQVFLQFILRFYPIRYQHLKLRLQRLSSMRNKKLKS